MLRIHSITPIAVAEGTRHVVNIVDGNAAYTIEATSEQLQSYGLMQRAILDRIGLMWLDYICEGHAAEQADFRWRESVAMHLNATAERQRIAAAEETKKQTTPTPVVTPPTTKLAN